MKRIVEVLSLITLTGIIFLSVSGREKKEVGTPEISSQKYSHLFHSGDIIFRDGRGAISSLFRKLSLKDPRYSHAGIIHVEDDNIYVYHVIGGEGQSENKMRRELLSSFISPSANNAFCVYRLDLDSAAMDSVTTAWYKSGITFDPEFDLSTDQKLYCTELVLKVAETVAQQRQYFESSIISGRSYIACDNIYLSSHSKKIYQYIYNR